MSTIKPVPVPLYRTADNLDTAMAEIKHMLYPYDPNTVHSLVMLYHNTLIKEMLKPVELPYGDSPRTKH